MAQIDTTIGDMPWLMRGPDQNALARGVQSGATIANARNQRAALAQRKFEFEREQMVREAQERRAQAMLPLQQTLMDQEKRLNQHKLTGLLEARENYVANEKDIAELTGKLSRSSDPVSSLTQLRDAIAKNHKLIEDPRFISLSDNLTKQIDMLGNLDMQKARAAQYERSLNPEIIPVRNPVTGKDVAYGRTGPNSFERIPEKATAQSVADKQNVDQLRKQADILTREWLKLDPDVQGNKTKRIKLAFQVGDIQKRISAILAKDEGADQPTPPATKPTPTTEQQPGPTKRLQWTPEGLIPAQ